jgi:cytochrome c
MRATLFLLPMLLAACASPLDAKPSAPDSQVAEGEYLARLHCASCHAIGARDQSKHPEAPPFRILSRSYPVSALEEPLAEGIMVGHPEMPEFRFRPEDVAAMIAFLESIQEK